MRFVWNAFDGRYADSPRVLHDALVARGPVGGSGDEHVWLADPRHLAGFPAGVRTVPIASAAASAALDAADVVVANCHLALDPWTPRPGVRYLQTWHGTPLKRIHRSALWLPPEEVMAPLDADIARWSALVTPSAAGTELLREAFAYGGEVLETGYPRNDVLSAPDREQRRAAVRERLGIAEGTTAVLYAPTYRDDEAVGDDALALGLDVPSLVDALGGGSVLMLRLHYYVAHRRTSTSDPRVLDVSSHPDATELLLAADVLVTDYSSALFDFAVTGRPILLFTYDLERYRDSLRGFTLDLDAEAPGPLLRSQGELAEALGDLPGVAAASEQRYAAFRERYCALEDGHATDRVLEAFLGA